MYVNNVSIPLLWYVLLQDALGTPGARVKPGEKAETPLTDVINRNLKVALANSSRCPASDLQALGASPELDKRPEPQVHTHTHEIWI